jgi:hypothetical protein
MPNELLEFLYRLNLTRTESKICFLFLRELTGWHYKFKPMELSFISNKIGVLDKNIIRALKSLIAKGVIEVKKVRGYRTHCYGFNEKNIGRILIGKEQKVFTDDEAKVIDLKTFKVSKTSTSNNQFSNFQSIDYDTEKTPKAAPIKNSAKSKYIGNTLNISLREMKNFLQSRSLNSRARWTALIGNILKDHPEDEAALWLAIDLVYRTQKDFLNRPIRSSVINLFEQCEWPVLKAAMLGQLEREEKEKKRKEQERLIADKKCQLEQEIKNSSSPERASEELAKIRNIIKFNRG